MRTRRQGVLSGMSVVVAAVALFSSSAGAAPTGCAAGTPAYGVGISITPEFVGTNEVAVAAYPDELIDYDITVFLRVEPGQVIVCPIHDGTVTVTIPGGAAKVTVATGVSLTVGQSVTFANVPATKYAVNEADAVVGGLRRVEALATVAATSDGPDDGPADDSPVTATAIAPTFLLAPSTQLSITPDRTVALTGGQVGWTVVERNDTPAGYFPVSLTAPRVELSTDGGATAFSTLTSSTAGMTGDNGNGLLDVGEAWTWSVTTTPADDVTVVATGFGTGPRDRVVTFPGDPEERASGAVAVLAPSTVIEIRAAPTLVSPGTPVQWTVSERNDGDDPLTNPMVRLDIDGGDDGDLATLSAPPQGGDIDADGVLDPGETWTWVVTTNPDINTTVTATGHGIDSFRRDITFPLDPEERASASVLVVREPLPPTGVPPLTLSIAGVGLALLLVGSALRTLSEARLRRS